MAKDPAIVVLLRHAEETGKDNDPHLSPKGRRRALALAARLPGTIYRPHVLFAPQPSNKSRRSLETVEPLARALGLTVNAKHPNERYEHVADLVRDKEKYEGLTIVIAWNHGNLPELAEELGARGVPKHWPDESYDRFWILTYDKKTPSFRDISQKTIIGPI